MQIVTWDRVSFRGGAGWLHGAQECAPAFRRLQKCTAKRAKHCLWEVNFPHLRAAFEPRRRGPFRWRFGSPLALTLNERNGDVSPTTVLVLRVHAHKYQ